MDLPYRVDYAKSNRSHCRGCKSGIEKDILRLAVMKQSCMFDGKTPNWYHESCFFKRHKPKTIGDIGNFGSIRWDDQEKINAKIQNANLKNGNKRHAVAARVVEKEDVPEKKPKVEDDIDSGAGSELKEKLKAQNELFISYRDELKKLKKSELKLILETNYQRVRLREQNILDRIGDIMAFGGLRRCEVCKHGQLFADESGYKCYGFQTKWSKCNAITKEPKRDPFVVPEELKAKYKFLEEYKYVPDTRLFRDAKSTSYRSKVERQLPLYNMTFVIIGKVNGKKDELKKQIVSFGGKVTTKIKETVMAVISTAADVEKMGSRIINAMDADIQVVSPEFIDQVKEYTGHIPELILKISICTWGSDPHTRLPPEPSSSGSKLKSNFIPSKIKVKSSGAVDPLSGLEGCAHVYRSGEGKYTAVLGLTDIQTQRNCYYKLQLLEANKGNKFWLFRSWGRIGTKRGGNQIKEMDLEEAKSKFCQLYKKESGNDWHNRANFYKVPGLLYPIDVDYVEEEIELNLNVSSKLPKQVQQLIELIFDVSEMKKLMSKFELHTEKMPLGKLSKLQLQNAYGILTELEQLVHLGGTKSQFIDASNRFYTFVPHSFGVNNPPVIDNLKMIKKKLKMLDSLKELEVAYSLIKATGGNYTIDGYYDELKAEIDILDRSSEEFTIIQDYVKNTHAKTHTNYELKLQEVFTIKRQGEEERYEPFKKLHNRKLLWHGSRTTNFAGIISQGLRIAPPEAPVTGYMFGKGVYFADMVSKSANYCYTDNSNSTGLLLLCEVALGEMHELEHAETIEELPEGKHSVKGVGRTEPDPKHTKQIHDDVLVPVGKGITMNELETSLLYNEYVVYDEAQVNIKYLLKMEFKYK